MLCLIHRMLNAHQLRCQKVLVLEQLLTKDYKAIKIKAKF